MDSILIWCGLNVEQDTLEKALGDKCFSIQGSTPDDKKVEFEERWRNGERPVLITKSRCFGWGMNWQHCSKMIFIGLSDSFEEYYQAVRRCWRFGQTDPVDVYIIISDAEGAVRANIERKQKDAERMKEELVKHTRDILSAEIHSTVKISDSYKTNMRMEIPSWLKSMA